MTAREHEYVCLCWKCCSGRDNKTEEKLPDTTEPPQIVRTAQKSLYVGKYEVLSGVAQRERRHSSF